jgi:hypothetical protein
MAQLTTQELRILRNMLERGSDEIGYTKPQVNAAHQAIEDAMTTQNIPQAAVGATIPQYIATRLDNASSPFQFSNVQKRRMFANWAWLKFDRDK